VLTESAQVELQSELTIEVKSSELEVIPDAKRVSRPRGKSRQ